MTVVKMINLLNLQHKNISFTMEKENNGVLNFLDVKVTLDNGNFILTSYVKPTNKGLYMFWNSFLPINFKLNLFKCLAFRSFKICSKISNFHNELNNLKQKFSVLGYPENVLIDLVDKSKWCFNKNVEKFYGPSKKLVFTKFPYIGISGIILRKELLSLCKRFRPNIDLKVVNFGSFRIRNLFPVKDIISLQHVSNVVYCLKCNDCDQQYYGSTSRHLHTRVCEHRLALQGRGHSSVADHMMAFQHNICFDKPLIVNRDKCEKRLRLKESLYIRNSKPTTLINNMHSSCELFVFT
jgi:hypothetical protein